MLSGQLPFEVEGGDNEIKELIGIIMAGLTKQNFERLGQVSIESKLLISQLLMVDQNSRIKIEDVSKSVWISKMEEEQLQERPITLTLEMQLKVAKMVHSNLSHCILCHS